MGQADIVRRHFSKKTGTDKDIPIIKDGGYIVDDKGNKIREIKRVSESRQIEVKEFENGKEKNVRKISC